LHTYLVQVSVELLPIIGEGKKRKGMGEGMGERENLGRRTEKRRGTMRARVSFSEVMGRRSEERRSLSDA